MPFPCTIILPAEIAINSLEFQQSIANKLGIEPTTIQHIQVQKSSIDARKKAIKRNFQVLVYQHHETIDNPQYTPPIYTNVESKTPILIVGAGPAGLFAALKIIELGYKPIVIERGKMVQQRRRDLANLTKNHVLNPDSNYCFGEGGAGTYSDGKLYTRSNKRGDIQSILTLFCQHGAATNILVESHPHIGTNKLPKIIENIRHTILQYGGEIHFETKLLQFILENQTIKGIVTNKGTIESDRVILATGHSARDVYHLLHQQNIAIEAKPFALGVRIEHPQPIIDAMQYHLSPSSIRPEYLPAAPYSIVNQVEGRGVYSFCMCPGGIIAPCSTEEGLVVTNGWSPSKRDSAFANSGLVTEIRLEDMKEYAQYGELAGIYFQQEIERKACISAGGTQAAPAQRLMDFIHNKKSATLPICSYIPGIHSVEIKEVLPSFVTKSLRQGLLHFTKTLKGYATNEAVLVATESRTSSPVRIPRDKITLQHTQIKGLYPCAEGAGYAGGIVSAAIDGQHCAVAAVSQS